MIRITRDEHRERLGRLREAVAEAGLDLFLVSSFDSIYYLTGAGFEPLERPFFLLVGPPGGQEPVLLVPRLDEQHMGKARHVIGDDPHLPGMPRAGGPAVGRRASRADRPGAAGRRRADAAPGYLRTR